MKIINVRLTPNASSNKIGQTTEMITGEEELNVYVTSPPEKGEANKAMIKLLAKHFNINISSIEIIKGSTSRKKLIRIK